MDKKSERRVGRKVKRYKRVGERRKKSDKQGAGEVGLDRYREKLQNRAKRKRRRKARRKKVVGFGKKVIAGVKARAIARRNRRRLESSRRALAVKVRAAEHTRRMMHTIKDIHKDYLKNVDDPIETRLFKQLCEEFNMQVIELVLDGKEFSMGNNLSTLSIRRIERNPSKPTIDWWESNKYKQELLAEGKQLYNSESGKVRSGLSTTPTPGTTNTTGRSLDVNWLTKLPIGLPQPEE